MKFTKTQSMLGMDIVKIISLDIISEYIKGDTCI